jgi:HEAT repeat protein
MHDDRIHLLISDLLSDQPQRGLLAAKELAQMGSAAAPAVPALIQAIDRGDRAFARAAADAIGAIGPAAVDAIPALVRRCRIADTTPGNEALAVANALGCLGHESVEPLKQLVSDPHPNLRIAGVYGLLRMGSFADGAIPVLVAALGDINEEVRHIAIDALSILGDRAEEALNRAIVDGNGMRRVGASTVLLRKRPDHETAIETAKNELFNERSDVRAEAAFALYNYAKRSAASAAPELVKALKDSHRAVRAFAAGAIHAFDEEARRPLVADLISALDDPWLDVRQEASGALEPFAMEVPGLIARLTQLLDDPDDIVRQNAAYALGSCGEAAKMALPALHRLVNERGAPDSDDDTERDAYEAAIRWIEGR